MSIKEAIESDLKAAMLAGDKTLVTTLRGLKSAILYAEVASGSREAGLSDQDVITLLTKEAKKRQESADLYDQGGNPEKAAAERAEKEVINKYLPAQITDEELHKAVEAVMSDMGGITKDQMGMVIGKVKAAVGAGADGTRIAAAVKARIQWIWFLPCLSLNQGL